MGIFFTIVVIILVTIKITSFVYDKKLIKSLKQKELFKEKIKGFTYKFLQPLVYDDEKYQLYSPISTDKLRIYVKLLKENFADDSILSSNLIMIEESDKLNIIKRIAKTDKIALLKEIRLKSSLELKEAILLVDEISELDEIPNNSKLADIIDLIDVETLSPTYQSAHWTIPDSLNLLNDMFFEILFKKFIKQFANDNSDCIDDWESIRKCYVRTFENNMDYLIYIKHYAKLKKIDVPDNIESSVNNYIEELSLENQTNKYKNLMKNNQKLEKNNVKIHDVDGLDGFAFEYLLGALFKQMNYKVEVTRGSGDQGADIIISKMGRKTVVQAKCYLNNVSNKAIQEVVAAIKYYNADAGMVVTNSYYTKGAKELAEANNIVLWDRDKLSQMLSAYPVVLDEI